jgi:ABC-2 type transport system permease protein
LKSIDSVPIYDSARRSIPAIEELRDLYEYRYLILQLVRRDILTRYKRSILGIAWTMLNPLGTMIVLTIVFSQAFGITDQKYPAYVLSGLLAWNFFSQTTNAAVFNLVWGGSLLKRIYVPRTVFAISAAGTGVVNLLLALVPLAAVMLFTGLPISWTWIFVPIPIILMILFSIGVGLIVSSLAIFYSDVAEMFQIVMMAWFYLTPIIYTAEIIPPQFLVWIRIFNPMFHLMVLFRQSVYSGVTPDWNTFLISTAFSLATLIVGWLIFTGKSDEYAYRV